MKAKLLALWRVVWLKEFKPGDEMKRIWFNGWDVSKVCQGAVACRLPWVTTRGRVKLFVSECLEGRLMAPKVKLDSRNRLRTIWREGDVRWSRSKAPIPAGSRAERRRAWREGREAWVEAAAVSRVKEA